jgi:Na+/melibiose symporter-like transporter
MFEKFNEKSYMPFFIKHWALKNQQQASYTFMYLYVFMTLIVFIACRCKESGSKKTQIRIGSMMLLEPSCLHNAMKKWRSYEAFSSKIRLFR